MTTEEDTGPGGARRRHVRLLLVQPDLAGKQRPHIAEGVFVGDARHAIGLAQRSSSNAPMRCSVSSSSSSIASMPGFSSLRTPRNALPGVPFTGEGDDHGNACFRQWRLIDADAESRPTARLPRLPPRRAPPSTLEQGRHQTPQALQAVTAGPVPHQVIARRRLAQLIHAGHFAAITTIHSLMPASSAIDARRVGQRPAPR